MRIVIDLQAAQASNARRGVGRYAMALVTSMVRLRGEHEVIVALNGQFPASIDTIRCALDGLLPPQNIRTWLAPGPLDSLDPALSDRQRAAELVREAFLASLAPDWVLVSSLFEDGHNAVTSVGALGCGQATAVVLYDLIPLLYPELYLVGETRRRWYESKLHQLRQADLLLSISAASGAEAVEQIGVHADAVVNISGAAAGHFHPVAVSPAQRDRLASVHHISRPFVMYTGGIDHRKNIEGLIRAWAKLPQALRAAHQLAVVCAYDPADGDRLRELAASHGLGPDDLVLTGYVSEDDLVVFYNLCAAFVFPSWHEGFGLPVLEAMACGRAVLAGNTSSLPEVVGRDDALFDPFNDDAIADGITRVLTDTEFRSSLERHGREHSSRFSWDSSARRAWAALEAAQARRQPTPEKPTVRPRLAYVSPLPPQRSGIAGHSAMLLPELARYYDIDVIATEPVSDGGVNAACTVRSVDWLRTHAGDYARVLYHIGNSEFHEHMFALLREVPGIVVLHDFFLSGILAQMERDNHPPHAWVSSLYDEYGYQAVSERLDPSKPERAKWEYPCSFGVLRDALGVIVHAPSTRRRIEHWYGQALARGVHVVPLPRVQAEQSDRALARRRLQLRDDDVLVCSFGMLGPTKLNHRLLDAWLASPLADDPRCHLVFVGENPPGRYAEQLKQRMRRGGGAGRVRITGWTDAQTFRDYLAAADIGVQLRASERRELSAALLDCMNHGVATIANADDSAVDVSPDTVSMLAEDFSDEDLAGALLSLRRDTRRRQAMGQRAREVIHAHHRPDRCALQYHQAIESIHARQACGVPGLVNAIARGIPEMLPAESQRLAAAIAANHPPPRPLRQLLVDVSELVRRDARTGIQRVTRSILRELLAHPPQGFRVEPVYAAIDAIGYAYARRFTCNFMGVDGAWALDEPIETQAGDIFIGLDLQPHIVPVQKDYLAGLRRFGVKTYFVVYDLLPTLQPEVFVPGARPLMQAWLQTITQADGALCISRATAHELKSWLTVFGEPREQPFRIGWFHLGADVENSVPTRGMPPDAERVLGELAKRPTFLMVGTLEPRKGHAQALSAFEHLWYQGVDVNLVIVGSHGWMMDAVVDRLRVHRERGIRLFWLESISDEYLEKVYAASACLLAPSEGEGFGLPLIEAAQKRLPVLARDLPVFREVAGDCAYYFTNDKRPAFLVDAIHAWLALYKRRAHPVTDNMRWLSWAASTRQMLRGPLRDIWRTEWLPDGVYRFWGSDPRLFTQVGRVRGTSMETTGNDGFLLYGPYKAYPAGHYRLVLSGEAQRLEGDGCWLDVSCDLGERQLANLPLRAFGSVWQMAVDFVLEQAAPDLELRVRVNAAAILRIDRVRIEPQQHAQPHGALHHSPSTISSEA